MPVSFQVVTFTVYTILLGAMVWLLYKIYRRLDEARNLLKITKEYQELLKIEASRIPNTIKESIKKEVQEVRESNSGIHM